MIGFYATNVTTADTRNLRTRTLGPPNPGATRPGVRAPPAFMDIASKITPCSGRKCQLSLFDLHTIRKTQTFYPRITKCNLSSRACAFNALTFARQQPINKNDNLKVGRSSPYKDGAQKIQNGANLLALQGC